MSFTLKSSYLKRSGFFVFIFTVNLLILSHFHDRFWWPPDEGHFAHVAERMLAGEVLHADIQEHHGDLINFVHAAAFRYFGKNLVSLRYPLAALFVAQSCLVFFLFSEFSLWVAMAASLTITSLSFVQFLNPTPNWYCLFFTLLTVTTLVKMAPGARGRIELAGLWIGTSFFFRQLNGTLGAAGIFSYLILETCTIQPVLKKQGSSFFARAAVLAILIALLIYYVKETDILGFLLFGIWPVLLLAWCVMRAPLSFWPVFHLMLGLARGAFIAFLPIGFYHLLHGSTAAWLYESFWDALRLPEKLWYRELSSYSFFLFESVDQLSRPKSFPVLLNNLYWLVLPLLGAVNGIWTVLEVVRGKSRHFSDLALPWMAVFYAPIALFHQIHIYLYYTAGLCLISLLWLACQRSYRRSLLFSFWVLVMSGIALYFHAAQPATRTIRDAVSGSRVALEKNEKFSHASLWLQHRDILVYERVLERIRKASGPGDSILSVPFNPEIYFLSERRNPFSFYNTAHGITDETEAQRIIEKLSVDPPKVVIHRPASNYRTPLLMPVLNYVRTHYKSVTRIGRFHVYENFEA